ncbi:MAG: calcium-binding protein [Chloroflexota bacterium]|nr:calcium-binding protein [Chloroflexota bacterium]
MERPSINEEREQRIHMEIIVDAYGPDEQAMGWYYYLEEHLQFPFPTACVTKRATSPLRVGDEVEVVGLAPEDECGHEMFVLMPWKRDTLAVPLSQLKFVTGDPQTQQAVEDWHYWTARGYQL